MIFIFQNRTSKERSFAENDDFTYQKHNYQFIIEMLKCENNNRRYIHLSCIDLMEELCGMRITFANFNVILIIQ